MADFSKIGLNRTCFLTSETQSVTCAKARIQNSSIKLAVFPDGGRTLIFCLIHAKAPKGAITFENKSLENGSDHP